MDGFFVNQFQYYSEGLCEYILTLFSSKTHKYVNQVCLSQIITRLGHHIQRYGES